MTGAQHAQKSLVQFRLERAVLRLEIEQRESFMSVAHRFGHQPRQRFESVLVPNQASASTSTK